MKARNLLWISMINIFLLLLVSVVSEYSGLTDRFEAIQNNVSTSLNSAITVSMASEEFFSEKYSYMQSSLATKADVSNVAVNNLRVYIDNKGWTTGNVYVFSKFYNEKGYFPRNYHEYTTYKNSFGSAEDIYEWLFGGTGSSYQKFGWANKGTKLWGSYVYNGYRSKDRSPTANFSAFYNGVGRYMQSSTYIKEKSGSTYNLLSITVPSLALTGLNLSSYNKDTSNRTNDFLSSSIHFGKSASGLATTQYFLTPFSLGVTYIPTEVLKPVFIGHLQQLVLYSKVKAVPTNHGNNADFNDGLGCISTSVYDNGSNASHLKGSSENIINDGEVEYDLSSAKVKVEYFYIDYYNNSHFNVVNRIEGATPRYSAGVLLPSSGSNSLNTLPSRLKALDTSDSKYANRVVARVSVKLKLHVPYKSSVLQWFRHLTDNSGVNHYDVRLWDEANNRVDINEDGVWFTYTTYTAITR